MSIKRILILLQNYYRILSRYKGGSGVFHKRLKRVMVSSMLSASLITTMMLCQNVTNVFAEESKEMEELQITDFTFDKIGSQKAGTRVVLSTECKGGTGEYSYCYTVKLPNGSYETIAEDTEADCISYTAEQVGVYNFEVKVKDEYDTVTDIRELIVIPTKVSLNSVKLNKKSYKVNESVKFTVSATPSSGIAKTKIVVKTPDGKSVKVKDFSTGKTASYKVTKKGTYKVTFYAKDSKTSTSTTKSFKVQ